jgi:hypothetical protein
MEKMVSHEQLARPFLRAGRANISSALADVTIGGRFLPKSKPSCYCFDDHRRGATRSLNRPIFFVYRAGTRGWGSVRLRVFQLAVALKGVVANPRFVRVVTEREMASINPTGAHIIFTKWVLVEGNRDWIRLLRKRRNTIWSDLVDGVPEADVEELVDYFLCSSESELHYRREAGIASVRILHNVDSRFSVKSFDRESLAIGYLGVRENVQLFPELATVDTCFTDTSMSSRQVLQVASTIGNWSHHYSVRTPVPAGIFKPATKIFLAARLGALFIGSRDDMESQLILGNDYPYLASSSKPKDVGEVIGFARESFLGPIWEIARDRMTQVREESCDVFVAQQLAQALVADGPLLAQE